MKNVKWVAKRSADGAKNGKPVSLYYNIKEDAVYTQLGQGRYFVTLLIRENTEEEIIDTVNRFMAM